MEMKGWLRTAAIAARNVLVGGNLRALGLIGEPRRLVHYASESLFLYKTLTGSRELPQQSVAAAFPATGPWQITLAGLDDDAWSGPVASYTADLVALCLLCRHLEPRTVFEIGTLNGFMAYHFALNAPAARVLTLDLPKTGSESGTRLDVTPVDRMHIAAARSAVEYCFDGTPEAGRIECLFGDSATFDYSPYHGSVDLFFIDGAHSYEYVSSDTDNALRCCRAGGIIAWHDYGRAGVNGVSRFLSEFRRAGHDVRSVPGSSVAFLKIPR
jgi:predicted O-methyltransferase YrrM